MQPLEWMGGDPRVVSGDFGKYDMLKGDHIITLNDCNKDGYRESRGLRKS